MNQKIMGIIAGIFVALVVMGAIGFVYAQQTAVDNSNVVAKDTSFVDADNDGVCDHAQSGDCPYKNQANGFVDANNDGVCDNAANCPMHNSNGGCHGSEECPYRTAGRMNCHS